MAPFVAASSDLAITIGEIERKVDMSLDDIIKQSRGMGKKQHTKVKDWNRIRSMQPNSLIRVQQAQQPQQQKGPRPFRRGLQQKRELQQGRVPLQRKELLQRFVTLRSSALRQEKLKEARARSGASMIAASQPAARQALPGNAITPLNRFSRKAIQGGTGLVRAAARQAKMLTAARNTKTVIVNQLSMTDAARRPAISQVVSMPRRMPNQSQRHIWRPNKVMANASIRRPQPQTLDSRFASLREERQFNLQFNSSAAWRR